MSKIRLGEKPFLSIQGEGNRTGVLTVFVRFFGCNKKCPGFFHINPTDPKNIEIQKTLIDVSKYKSVNELPVVEFGCDSLYSIDLAFKHLAIDYKSATDLYKTAIAPLLPDSETGTWQHPATMNDIDICFTGGEPMLQQGAMVDLLTQCTENHITVDRGANKGPYVVQIETNGTKPLQDVFRDYYMHGSYILNWNISPKLYNVSGEKDSIDVDIIKQYHDLSPVGHLKFVITNSEAAWDELRAYVDKLVKLGIDFPIFVMPVGSTREQQSDTAILSKIANRAIQEGYYVSGRLHTTLFGNGIGT